ncbi:MAG: NosD domain-containing protein [Candidatus Bathyarchaeia archaeon]
MANGGMNIIGYGILVKGSNNLVVNNSITGVWYGIGTSSSSSSNTIMGNNFSVVPRPLDIDGSNNLIKEHFISHTGFAFTVFLSGFHNTLFNNTIIADGWVLTIASSQYCTVSDNNIIRMGYTGSEAGIWIWNSQFNTIINNTIKNHSVGILIEGDSSNNIIYHNNFRNNIKQAVAPEPVTNIWDDGYPSGGNYWSDYTGIDANNDGIGDTPYIINASNIDHYPLMYPYYTHLPVGDITGSADMPDGKVDMYDVGLAAYAFGSYPGHERWRPAADITGPD